MRAAHNETVVQMTGRGGVPSATLSDRSGFVFFPGFLTAMEQQRWVRRILRRYISTPHRTNRGETSDLWNSYVRSESPELRLQDISWSTLGWHYNWTERAYHEGDASPFPPELDDLSRRVAAACGQSIVPEAAIVNLYAAGSSTMGGHRDDLERTFDAPVVSVSLGCTAVFLLGKHTTHSTLVGDGTDIMISAFRWTGQICEAICNPRARWRRDGHGRQHPSRYPR